MRQNLFVCRIMEKDLALLNRTLKINENPLRKNDLQERRGVHRHADGLTVTGVVFGVEQNTLADAV